MEQIIPQPGMKGAYIKANQGYSLRVEVKSYEPLSNGKSLIGLKVLKDFNLGSRCPHKEGKTFRVMMNLSDEFSLERLLLEHKA